MWIVKGWPPSEKRWNDPDDGDGMCARSGLIRPRM
jgi:hypothetical protein